LSGLQLTIPAQNDTRPGVKIKPREVGQWLDNLPYLDLRRAAQASSEQLRLINRQVLGSAARLEILGHFLRTYHRLDASLPANPADADSIQPLLRRLCQDIGFGYKIVAHGLINKRAGFIEARNLSLALLGSIFTLGLHLSYYYAGYQRAPRALWSECLALYRYARQSGRQDFSTDLPGSGHTQIETAFRLIALLRLADPYSLPAGMVAALRDYFEARTGLICIEDEGDSDGCGIPLSAPDEPQNDGAQQQPLQVNLTALSEQLGKDIGQLEQHGQSQALGLRAEVPASTLLRTLRQVQGLWETQQTRSAERQPAHARIELVSGLDAAYCVLNKGRWFNPALFLSPAHDDSIDLGARPAPEIARRKAPDSFNCNSVNRSSGGLAVRYRGTQTPHPRVGQLIALRRSIEGNDTNWVIAASRWLMEAESASGFDLGLQYLARNPTPAVIRANGTSELGGEYHPAISAIQRRGEQQVYTLMTRSGAVRQGDDMTIYDADGSAQEARCSELLESAPGFERFIYERL
jgi:hypothetical protein